MEEVATNCVKVEEMIYEVRGVQVMFASSLARLYGVETKRINEAVRNNPQKFPERFSWIREETIMYSRSKISTLNDEKLKQGQNLKYCPRVFTEQGVAMLAIILKSKTAVEVSIHIMDAFVAMRHYIDENRDVYKSLSYINNKLVEHDEKINFIFSKFNKKEQLFLPGEVFDAYTAIVDILGEAKECIVIIDSYADISLLNFIKNLSVPIILITSNKAKLTALELDKFNKQYKNKLKMVKNNTFHDRYFIIDKKEIYHVGTSLNYAGEKTFSINKLEDKIIKEHLVGYVVQVINE